MVVEMRTRKRTIDPKEIAKEVMNGSSFDYIQQKYGIKMRSQVLDLYTKGLAQLQEIPKLNSTPAKKPAASPKRITSKAKRAIGSSGTITLTRALLIDELGFSEGDEFTVHRQGNTIILEKTN